MNFHFLSLPEKNYGKLWMDIIVIEKAISWHSTIFQYLVIVFRNMKFYLFIFLIEQHIFYRIYSIEIFFIF